MKSVNTEKFLADYELVVQEKENFEANKASAIEAEKERVDALEGFSDHVKEILLAEVVAEKEKEFDATEIEERMAKFEKYLDDVVEEEPIVEDELSEEHPEDCECDECIAKRNSIVIDEPEEVINNDILAENNSDTFLA